MWNLYDIFYGLCIGLSAPYWLVWPPARRKVLGACKRRMGHDVASRQGNEPTVFIHAVSLGEMNATRMLIDTLRGDRSGVRFVVSTTTDTGYARGIELYGQATDIDVIRYPVDFSSAVKRVLDAIRPDVVVLMELEVWPNFIKRCEERHIPVMLANARLTPSSYRNYRRADLFLRPTFQRLSLVCAQDVTYGERFIALGVPPHRVVVTGTMKFDNANATVSAASAREQAERVGLQLGEEIIWVCGSTGPGEEQIILRVFRRMLARFSRLRLVIVPRHPQRFDEVEQIVLDHKFQCLRHSGLRREMIDFSAVIPPVVLVDAMGVLRDFYAVATIVFVGRTLVDLGHRQHGSDMIEPAALGRPVIVGPYTANFAEAMRKFREADAILEVQDDQSLEQAVAVLLSTPKEAWAIGQRAGEVVARERGATARHAVVIEQILAAKRGEEIETRPVNPIVSHLPPSPQVQLHALAPTQEQPIESPPPKSSGKVVITRLGPVPPTDQ